MCWEYDVQYCLRRAEEARQAMKEAQEKLKQKERPSSRAEPRPTEPGAKEPVPA